MHGRRRMTILSYSDSAGTENVGERRLFADQADIARLHQARSAVGCYASRIKGELHPMYDTKTRV